MDVLKAKVNWMDGYASDPILEILVDRVPSTEACRFEQRGPLWFAELDGFVEFFAWHGPGNEGGFCGTEIEITMTDGRQVTLKGPWSSNSRAMEEAGFPPSVCVTIRDPRNWERGGGLAGHITLEKAREVLSQHLPDIEIYRTELGFWVPKRKGHPPKNP